MLERLRLAFRPDHQSREASTSCFDRPATSTPPRGPQAPAKQLDIGAILQRGLRPPHGHHNHEHHGRNEEEDGLEGMKAYEGVPVVGFEDQEQDPGAQCQHVTQHSRDVASHLAAARAWLCCRLGSARGYRLGCRLGSAGRARLGCRLGSADCARLGCRLGSARRAHLLPALRTKARARGNLVSTTGAKCHDVLLAPPALWFQQDLAAGAERSTEAREHESKPQRAWLGHCNAPARGSGKGEVGLEISPTGCLLVLQGLSGYCVECAKAVMLGSAKLPAEKAFGWQRLELWSSGFAWEV